jgi:uracil phosphoribosyltransferase
MLKLLISILRNKNTTALEFREASEKLATLLAIQTAELLDKQAVTIQTPLAKAEGIEMKNSITLVPILRSGLALLTPFLQFYPQANIGIIGMRRHEVTAEPENYYHNLPAVSNKDTIIVLEPMLATGGSLSVALELLLQKNALEEKIIVVNVIAAPEGYKLLKHKFPKVRFLIAQMDAALNEHYYIVPGLGDFGDRYFGTL